MLITRNTVTAVTAEHEKSELIDIFSYDIHELFCEYVAAIRREQFIEAIQTIEKFYSLWIESNKFSAIPPSDQQATVMMLSSLLIFALSGQLAWISHYSLQTSCGLTLLTISLGIKITTPSYISVGLLSNGFFHYHMRKRQGYYAVPYSYYRMRR